MVFHDAFLLRVRRGAAFLTIREVGRLTADNANPQAYRGLAVCLKKPPFFGSQSLHL